MSACSKCGAEMRRRGLLCSTCRVANDRALAKSTYDASAKSEGDGYEPPTGLCHINLDRPLNEARCDYVEDSEPLLLRPRSYFAKLARVAR